MAYVSPGGAFSSAIQDALLERDNIQLKHAQLDIQEKQLARETAKDLADQQARAQEDAETKRQNDVKEVTDELKNYTKGDYLPPELLAKAKALNVSIPSTPDPEAAASTTGASALSGDQTLGANAKPVAVRFAGSPAERKLDEDTQAALQFASTLPAGSPERAGLEYEAKTGFRRAAPAGMFGRQALTPETSLVVKGADGKVIPGVVSVQQGVPFLNGQPLPPGAHAEKGVDEGAQAARDNARSDRELTMWNTAHQQATAEFDKWAQSGDSQVVALRRAVQAINQKSPEADSIVAPLVLKGTVSGEGSGFRMTSGEIKSLMTGPVWDTLNDKLASWDPTTGKALKLDDAQRTRLYQLANAMLKQNENDVKKISQARQAATSAKDAREIATVRDNLYDSLYGADASSDSSPNKIYYDVNGNPVKK